MSGVCVRASSGVSRKSKDRAGAAREFCLLSACQAFSPPRDLENHANNRKPEVAVEEPSGLLILVIQRNGQLEVAIWFESPAKRCRGQCGHSSGRLCGQGAVAGQYSN